MSFSIAKLALTSGSSTLIHRASGIGKPTLVSLLATLVAVIIPMVQISRQGVHSSLKGL